MTAAVNSPLVAARLVLMHGLLSNEERSLAFVVGSLWEADPGIRAVANRTGAELFAEYTSDSLQLVLKTTVAAAPEALRALSAAIARTDWSDDELGAAFESAEWYASAPGLSPFESAWGGLEEQLFSVTDLPPGTHLVKTESVRRQSVAAFISRIWSNCDAALVVVGGLPAERVEAPFGLCLRPGQPRSRVVARGVLSGQSPPPITSGNSDVRTADVAVGCRASEADASFALVLRVGLRILARRAYTELREEEGLIYGSLSEIHARSFGVWGGLASQTASKNAQKVALWLREQLDAVARGEFTDEELLLAKQVVRSGLLQSFGLVEEWSELLADDFVSGTESKALSERLKVVSGITRRELRRAMRYCISGSSRTSVTYEEGP